VLKNAREMGVGDGLFDKIIMPLRIGSGDAVAQPVV
jgi:hypothetical protein